MVGRATFGQPWIFYEINQALGHTALSAGMLPSKHPLLSTGWKMDILREQVLTSVNRIDEYRGILHVRRHLAASPIFKGIPNFRETRIRMLRAETVGELFGILDEIEAKYL